jgi:glycosyltransferase involved in cell wall biosynthesis
MRLGIDASNLRAGGGVTHLVEMLRAANPRKHGFSQVIVWGAGATLDKISDRPWLKMELEPMLEKGLPNRTCWQRFRLSKLARRAGCELLFVPGGSYAGDFHPVVTMSRNLLPFLWRELGRYGLSWMTVKWMLLRWAQTRTFRQSDGVIFLTRYAQHAVTEATGSLKGRLATVPHGIDGRFLSAPRPQRALVDCSFTNPFRLLYVSIIDAYKHQWNVAEAVYRLRGDGLPVALDLVGPAYGPALKRLQKVLRRLDPTHSAIRHLGPVPYQELHRLYGAADASVFASTCENMPNILIESMASGLPIACSNHEPMPEVLGDAGVYFDPEDVGSICSALHELISSPGMRADKARAGFDRAGGYSWNLCADQTFCFLAEVAAASSSR